MNGDTYHITFFRRMTGERGVMPEVQGRKTVGLTYNEAEKAKLELEDNYGFLTDFYIMADNLPRMPV